MDKVNFCHAMEQLCRERIKSGSPHKDRWHIEMMEWEKRWHMHAALQFQGLETIQSTGKEARTH
jgi:hypothetical protein